MARPNSFRPSDRLAGGADRDRTGDPLLAKQVLSQLSYGPKIWLAEPELAGAKPAYALRPSARQPSPLRERRLVGQGRFELPTSRLSSARSNQLSY